MASINTGRSASVTTEGVAEDKQLALLNRISWGAVFAGVALAIVSQLLLNMLGVGVGLGALDIGPGADNSGSGFSIGAGLWWVLSGIIAAFLGGIAAGRLAGAAHGDTARWHGLITWCVSTLLVIYLLTSAVGGVLGGAFHALSSTVGGAGKALTSTASGAASVTDGDAVMQKARQLVDPNGAQTVQDSVSTYMKARVSGDDATAAAAKQQAVAGLAQSAHITPAEAQARLDRAEASAKQTLDTAKAKATQAADTARKGVSTAAILSVLALLLGAVAGWFGGQLGAKAHEGGAIMVDARRRV